MSESIFQDSALSDIIDKEQEQLIDNNKRNSIPEEHVSLLSRDNSKNIEKQPNNDEIKDSSNIPRENYQLLLNQSQISIYDPNAQKLNEPLEIVIKPTSRWQRIVEFVLGTFQNCHEKHKQHNSSIDGLTAKSTTNLLIRIGFQGGIAYWTWKKRLAFIERKKLAQEDLNLANKMKKELETDGFCYFKAAKQDNSKIIVKGKIDMNSIKGIKNTRLLTFNVDNEKIKGSIVVETDKNQFDKRAPVADLQSSKNCITSAVASVAYFLSQSVFKFTFKTDNRYSLANSFYFLGVKGQAKDVLKVSQITKAIDVLKHQTDQRVMVLCVIGCTLACGFYAFKAMKTLRGLVRKHREQLQQATESAFKKI